MEILQKKQVVSSLIPIIFVDQIWSLPLNPEHIRFKTV